MIEQSLAFAALFVSALVFVFVMRTAGDKGFRAVGATSVPRAQRLYYLAQAQLAAADGPYGIQFATAGLPCMIEADAERVVIRVASRGGVVLPSIELSLAARARLFTRHGRADNVPTLLRLSEGNAQHFFVAAWPTTFARSDPLEAQYQRLAASLSDARRVESGHSNWKEAAIALPILGIVIAALIHGALNENKPSGPDAAAVDAEQRIWLADAETFVRLDGDGDGADVHYRFADFGLREGISDWQFLADGSVLLGDYADGRIKRCTLSPARCALFDPKLPATEGAFKFRYLETERVLWVSDASAHQAFRWQDGTRTDLKLDDWGLCHPNRIELDRDGHVLLADTNHHRILRWNDATATAPTVLPAVAHNAAASRCGGVLGKRGAKVERRRVVAFDGLDSESRFPTDLVPLANGQIAVLLNDDRLHNGDVAILRPGQAALRLPLESGTDGWALAAWRGDVLVVDPLHARVQRFAADGRRLADVGESHLRVLRESGAEKRQFAQRLKWSMLAVVGLLLIGLLVLSTRARRAQIGRVLRAE